ncbi:uncharacterized protein LOC121404016 [Drosophila obscura]|uniref:uncharacterized protein LOC121404016 n=1 Tax=Drosophila obscura TaxID=7282 RepID=UPI001BB296CE|nr:uncharacterized protein LOC121404016 [Drosophila obscura]
MAPCDCTDCKRKVAAGLKDPNAEPEVRWAPRISPDRPLRQRDEFRRSEPPPQRSAEGARGRGGRSSRIRVKKSMRICVHTASSAAHGRTLGGRCQVCEEPTPTGGRQRALDRRRARHRVAPREGDRHARRGGRHGQGRRP